MFLLLATFVVLTNSWGYFWPKYIDNAVERDAVCNDGSPAGYLHNGFKGTSNKWLFIFPSGGGCYSEESCEKRRTTTHPQYTTNWYLKAASIFRKRYISSDYCPWNPGFCTWNKIYLPYCTSDWYVGETGPTSTNGMHFRGKTVVTAMIEDLIENHGLGDATDISVYGFSAGGTGALNRVDDIKEMVEAHNPEVKVSVIADSAWYRKNGKEQGPCTDDLDCFKDTQYKMGKDMWKMAPNKDCKDKLGTDSEWKCLFASEVIPHIKSRVLIGNNWYDYAQASCDGIRDANDLPKRMGALTEEDKDYIEYRAKKMRKSLKKVMDNTNVYIRGCYNHVLVSKYYERNNGGDAWGLAVMRFANGEDVSELDYCDETGIGECAVCTDYVRRGMLNETSWLDFDLDMELDPIFDGELPDGDF